MGRRARRACSTCTPARCAAACRSSASAGAPPSSRSLAGLLLVAAPDPELLHPAAECIRVEAEHPRCTAGTIDHPSALLERAEDVLPLNVLERRRIGGPFCDRGGHVGRRRP